VDKHSPVSGILIGHGSFAAGLASALTLIVGEVPDLEVLSSEGKGRPDIEQMVCEARLRFSSGPAIIFTDLQGGCSSTVCGSLLRSCDDVGIICGANLPMLVKFVEYRSRLPLAELHELLLQAGRDGVQELKKPC
jgi:PTS system N-acetylgalactosamine-specific IIA component